MITQLTGTEKQIAWATQIRNEMLRQIEKIASDFDAAASKSTEADAIEKMRQIIATAKSNVENQADSAWFISRAKVNIFRKDIPALAAGKF